MGRPGPSAYVKGQKHIKFPPTHRASLHGNPRGKASVGLVIDRSLSIGIMMAINLQ